ncbi:pyruvate kinase 2, putative [Plasmodium gallinaceum]|uniref:pyruvate kinase n=1 Tax=Plasmodium gallinaceum TaxID=5849 RepID=A0A1J1GXT8_PLAGA|nr:pyruvate kinase 2, putative [Plasmodium gallinaceum]CRG97378.1 pyruvate kinase 2, putative [Plasmodium gallinaceum]
MNIIHFCLFIELIKCFVNGLKNNKKIYDKLYIQKTENLLFLNNININKNLEKKKNILAHNETQILKNKNDINVLSKKNKISFTKSKQIATIGPASENFQQLEKLYLSGIDVFRLNFSHGLKNIKKYIIDSIRILEKKYDTSIGILGDIQGPKIRIGEFERNEDNEKEKNTFVELKEGDYFNFDLLDKPGDKNRVQLNYPELLKNINIGQIILLDDGNLKMKVIKSNYDTNNKNTSIKVEVITGGKLYSKKGFSIPNMIMPIEVLNEKDIKDILFCINEEVDFLGYSFVQTEYDLLFLKNIINDYYKSDFYKNKRKDRINYNLESLQIKDFDDENDFYIKEVNDYYHNYYLKNYEKYRKIYDVYKGQNLHIKDNKNSEADVDIYDDIMGNKNQFNHNNTDNMNTKNISLNEDSNNEILNDANKIYIISKIEKPSAVKNIENIIKQSDGIMIARGDLGIETNLSNLPILQKKIINLCRIKYNKPVIVATQMLESMRFLPSPTRAEISDVATALYDGSDCVMLSAETATGHYPILTASTQNRIIKDVENDYYYYEYAQKKNDKVKNIEQKNNLFHDNSNFNKIKEDNSNNSYFEKLIYSIRDISNNINLKSIILFSNEFNKIQKLSNLRTKAPIIVITENVYLARKLQLTWGVYPYLSKKKDLFNNDLLTLINYGCDISKEEGFINSADEYSLVTFTKNINSANLLYLCQPYLTNSK